MSKINEMLAEIDRLNGEVKGIFDQADASATSDRAEELDSQSWEKVKTNNQEIERLEKQVKALMDQEDARTKAAERGRLPTPGRAAAADSKAAGPKSVGQQLLDDPEFKAWRAKVSPAPGVVQRSAFGNSPALTVPGGMKTLLTGASNTSAGAMVYPQFLGVQDTGTWMRPLTIRDLITIGQTDSDTVEFVRVSGVTNNAAPVAEASATSGSTGAKPESAMTMEVATANVRSIAHWIPATRRALADAGQLRTYIDQFLRYGLDEELEDQIVNGAGTGENLTGIFNTTGTTVQAWATNLLTTTRQARTKVRVTGRATPTAYALHPNDWEDLDLLQDNEARYYFGGPSVLGNPRLWGLPVVESEAITEGTGLCADFRMATLWDREVAQILVSDSHSDFFVRNMIAILAELRVAFTLIRPAAFVEMDLTA